MRRFLFMIAGLVCTAALGQAKDFYVHDWTKIHANKHFWAEGGAVGDFNRDGHGDLVVGHTGMPGRISRPGTRFIRHGIVRDDDKDGKTVKVPGFPERSAGATATRRIFSVTCTT